MKDYARAVAETLLLVGVVGCSDEPRFPTEPQAPNRAFVVSEPGTGVGAAQTRMSSASANVTSAEGMVVYASLGAGMFPRATLAVIQNRSSSFEITRPIADGGLDPVAIEAAVGNIIDVTVKDAGGIVGTVTTTVPAIRQPIVVRTIPPRGKKDLPLNARIVIVFSEPIRSGSAGSIRLLRGSASVAGRATLTADGLRAEFQPDQLLGPNTDYTLSIPTDVTDVGGQPLQAPVLADFTTGTTVAAASVVTEEPALLVNIFNNKLRTFEVSAVRSADGSVTGSWKVFYAANGVLVSGRVTCLTIKNGREAWIAGVTEQSPDPNAVGVEMGWRAVDNGPPSGGRPDQLSLAFPLEDSGLGTAQDFCANTPLTSPIEGEILLSDLESGNIVMTEDGQLPPPPPPNDMSQIAFAAWPDGGIRVMRAGNLGSRALTTTAGDFNPSWSPDGKKLAFQGRRNASEDIYVINVDGSSLIRLTQDLAYEGDPAWSPDGRKIAYSRDGGIYLMNASDGSGATKLANSGGHPTWSPDGSRIAFHGAGGPAIFVMNADGSAVTRITSDTLSASYPAWSPDGKRIAFQSVDGIYLVNPDGTNLTRLTFGGQTPAWSPDSKVIVYDEYGITLINADGSGIAKRGTGFTPAWSPVGSMPPVIPPSLSIGIAGGDGQSDTVRATLAQPLKVRVARDDGSPAAGIEVNLLLDQSSGGSLPSAFAVTDGAGIASTKLTLGQAVGRTTVRALVTNGMSRSAGVVFVSTTTPGKPVKLSRLSNTFQYGAVDSILEYNVAVMDAYGNPVAGVPITWEMAFGSGSISPGQDTTKLYPGSSFYCCAYARGFHKLGPEDGASNVTAKALTLPAPQVVGFVADVVTKMVSVYSGFSPDTVSVPSGRTVGWSWIPEDTYNEDGGGNGVFHNVTFEDDPTQPTSSRTQYDGVFKRTFTGSPRNILYRCTLHSASFTSGEVGVIRVQ